MVKLSQFILFPSTERSHNQMKCLMNNNQMKMSYGEAVKSPTPTLEDVSFMSQLTSQLLEFTRLTHRRSTSSQDRERYGQGGECLRPRRHGERRRQKKGTVTPKHDAPHAEGKAVRLTMAGNVLAETAP